MNLFVVGWDLPRDLGPRLGAELAKQTRTCPQLDPATLWQAQPADELHVASLTTPRDALGPRRYVAEDSGRIVLFDGLPVDPRHGISAHDASTLGAHWNELETGFEGPYVALRLTSDPVACEVVTDPLGMRPVYVAAAGRGRLVSNSATLLARLLGGPGPDERGLSTFLAWGWCGGDRTPLDGIRVVCGGQHLRWEKGQPELQSRRYFGPVQVAQSDARGFVEADFDELADAVAGLIGPVARAFGQTGCGLTAGRDSRLIAAILADRGISPHYVTYAPRDSSEAILAQQVARILDLDFRIDDAEGGNVVDEWDAIVPDFVVQNDGMVSLHQLQVMVNRAPQLETLEVHVSGHGGEIARGFYLEPWLLRGTADRATLIDHLAGRASGDGSPLLSVDVARRAHEQVAGFVDEMLDAGIDANQIPDAFYVFERVGRWASTVTRPSLAVADLIQPFCTRPFVRIAFRGSLGERYRQRLHRDATLRFAPGLRGLSHGGGVVDRHRLLKDAGRAVLRRLPQRLRASGRGAPLHTRPGRWDRIRERCLDRSASPIWSSVDRRRFEALTATGSNLPASPQDVQALLRIGTAFYYEALFESFCDD